MSLIRLTNPLAGICGRVCSHPCEKMCKRGEIDEPIAIGSLKRFASDWERRQDKMAPPTFLERIKEPFVRRRTMLLDAIRCGRPGTQMPAWLDGAYTEISCYGLPKGAPPAGLELTPVLSSEEIEALVDYLLAKIVGK